MTRLEEQFRTLDRLEAPDLWLEAERRRPGTLGLHPRPSRFIAAAVALALAAICIGLVVRAFGGTAGKNPQPAISVPSGAIAFVRVAGPAIDAAREIYLMEPDGSGVRALTDAGSDGMVAAEPAWSPTGTRIAFVLSTPEHLGAYAGDGDVFLMNADGTRLIQLTHGLQAAHLAWSPDGSRIVFVRDQGTSLVVMNADGRARGRLRLTVRPIRPTSRRLGLPTEAGSLSRPHLLQVWTPTACTWRTSTVRERLGSRTVGRTGPLPGRRTAPCWRTPARTAYTWSMLRADPSTA
jgi:hypothetical protein